MPGNMRWSSAISQNPRHSLQNRSFEWAQRLPKPWPPRSVQSAFPIAATFFHDVVVGPVIPVPQFQNSRRAPVYHGRTSVLNGHQSCQCVGSCWHPRSVQIAFPIAATSSHGVAVGPVSRVPQSNNSRRAPDYVAWGVDCIPAPLIG